MSIRLLVVEDDPELCSVLRRSFVDEGFDVAIAADGASALQAASDDPGPDIIVLDIGLPDADGRDVCQAMRARGQHAPVVFLTARDAMTDRLSGFGAGGDDYITKPFAFVELLARVNALVRRTGAHRGTPNGAVRLDPAAHALVAGKQRVELTPTEFRLLARLMGASGDAVRRRDLLLAAWPDGAIVHDNTLDVYIARVRRKLRAVDGCPRIGTVHGVGYRAE